MSAVDGRLKALSREERVALCREVVENLSDYIEGTAPEAFCERVDELLADCQPFEAYRNTLAATIEMAAEVRDAAPRSEALDDEGFARCVKAVKARLLSDDPPES